jgi:hypothetical protein
MTEGHYSDQGFLKGVGNVTNNQTFINTYLSDKLLQGRGNGTYETPDGQSITWISSDIGRSVAAALGIEILCIAAAEIGENSGLYLFGFNPIGISICYVSPSIFLTSTYYHYYSSRHDYDNAVNADIHAQIDKFIAVFS